MASRGVELQGNGVQTTAPTDGMKAVPEEPAERPRTVRTKPAADVPVWMNERFIHGHYREIHGSVHLTLKVSAVTPAAVRGGGCLRRCRAAVPAAAGPYT